MNQIDLGVIQHQFHADLRVAHQKVIQRRQDVMPSKRRRQVEFQHSPGMLVQRRRGGFGVFQFIQYPACVYQEGLAAFGQMQRACGAVEQRDAQVLLKVLHIA